MEILSEGLSILLDFYSVIVIANIVLSWLVFGSESSVIRTIYLKTSQIVDPALQPIRKLLEPISRNTTIDLSPLVLLVLLHILNHILTRE